MGQVMLEKLRIIFTIPELRTRILITLGLLAVYRIGWQIPLPIIDQRAMESWAESSSQGAFGQLMEQVALFSASNLSQVTIFGLGIMPYISASIIFQLLGSVWPPLEKLQKEGESGRKKITEYTRYTTVLLALGQSIAYLQTVLQASGQSQLVRPEILTQAGTLPWGWFLLSILIMTSGTVFLMWVGEQIEEYGIGNGISLLIMAGIIAAMPGAGYRLLGQSSNELGAAFGPDKLLMLAALFVAVVAGVVFITMSQRRIPLQSAKHVKGRRVYGGGRNYLPLRVNQAGVMPIIFASSLLLFPAMILSAISQYVFTTGGFWASLTEEAGNAFQRGDGFVYNVTYVLLIFFFCFFWTAIVFNPKDMADNLKDSGSFIPGYRPGKPTEAYLEKVMVRITYVGAGFLALVAIIPTIVADYMQIDYTIASFYGGTGLLIAVSVAFDLVQQIDRHLISRNYRGLLDRS
ncbi:Protein translocase subunit SecY [Planctomycetales bacterium 10988]|nr:Protein translocase subunit SecY [Planctomycetales bacterium 10988]